MKPLTAFLSNRGIDFVIAGAVAIVAFAISPIGIRLATGRLDLSPRVTVLSLTFDAVLLIIAAGIVSRGPARRALLFALAAISPIALLATIESLAVAVHVTDRIAPLEDLSTLANRNGWPGHFMSSARHMEKDGLRLYRPWRGDGITINELGLRTTAPTPKRSGEWRIAVTGASVAFGWRVRDGDTIAVQMQEILHRQGFPNVRVYNFAIDSTMIADELALLKHFRKIYGIDQVVFLTGANDATDSYMSAAVADRYGLLGGGIAQFELLKLGGRLRALWLDPPAGLLARLDNELIPALARRNSLRDGVTAADDYCRAAALRCDFVLQPILLRRPTPRGPEVRIDHTLRHVYPRYDQVFATMYGTALGTGLPVHDASDVFDRSDQPYFVDVAHLNEAGNRQLAERLVRIVSGAIPRSDARTSGRR
jgi:lysophospholipase L1-like esterase